MRPFDMALRTGLNACMGCMNRHVVAPSEYMCRSMIVSIERLRTEGCCDPVRLGECVIGWHNGQRVGASLKIDARELASVAPEPIVLLAAGREVQGTHTQRQRQDELI